ncbi:hypothetical protein [Agromyces kandeliae]|uniref:Uncharacterized protein n=1 Tax=Agromyces kandeliae TaxID=2666141 RepID=A0A6L5QX28_9MICO|nr:hypothetical protein [Agromyces kandeliae]MRX42346.1 hypothetical protein [Agromyces kandeliae]
MTDSTYPPLWTQGAIDLYEEAIEERPDLKGLAHAALVQVCDLVAVADRGDAIALADGFVATGSAGQPIAHPSLVEARLARSSALTILARLVPPSGPNRQQREARSRRGRIGGGA